MKQASPRPHKLSHPVVWHGKMRLPCSSRKTGAGGGGVGTFGNGFTTASSPPPRTDAGMAFAVGGGCPAVGGACPAALPVLVSGSTTMTGGVGIGFGGGGASRKKNHEHHCNVHHAWCSRATHASNTRPAGALAGHTCGNSRHMRSWSLCRFSTPMSSIHLKT